MAEARADELSRFREQISKLHETLTGDAWLASIDFWFEIKLVGDGKGHVAIEGWIDDQAGIGNRLAFENGMDQTYLDPLIRQLDAVLQEYPVVGSPDAM